MNRYERRLPHWDVIGRPLFVTFRLHGSLPANRVFPPARLTTGEAFARMDRLLDTAVSGPMYLARPEIARLVYDRIVRTNFEFRRIRAYIENNPVKVGLAQSAELFQWSSACQAPPGKAAAARNG